MGTSSGTLGTSSLLPSFLVEGAILDGRYRLHSLAGQGGVGWVLEAEDTSSQGLRVALKVIFPHLLHNQRAMIRFHREASLTMRLTHPHIVQTYGVGEITDFSVYLVLELMTGASLRDVSYQTTADIGQKTKHLVQLLSAVDFAHRAGIIHRDLKLDNVLLSSEGAVKVADFGLASSARVGTDVTQIGEVLGTPLYMSPEQFRGELVDFRTDIYSFGVLAYELLLGTHPFPGDTFLEVAEAHSFAPIPPDLEESELPEHWKEIIARCLAKNPAERYPSVAALLGFLQSKESKRLADIDFRYIAQPLEIETRRFRAGGFWRVVQTVMLVIFVATAIGFVPYLLFNQGLSPYYYSQIAGKALRFEEVTGWKFFIYRKIGLLKVSIGETDGLFEDSYEAYYTKHLPLIAAGVELNLQHPKSGLSLLNYWVRTGERVWRKDLLQALLEGGANPNVLDSSGDTPLISAIRLADEPIIDLLLRAGASPSMESAKGISPLQVALRMRQLGVVEQLVFRGANPFVPTGSNFVAAEYAKDYRIERALTIFESVPRSVSH